MRQVCIKFTLSTHGFWSRFDDGLLINFVYTRFTPDLHKVFIVYTEFAHCLLPNRGFSWEFPPVGKCVKLIKFLCKPGNFSGKHLVNKQAFSHVGLLSVNLFGQCKLLKKL